MRVLITGAAGFIGKKAFLEFKHRGYEVFGWDRFDYNDEISVKSVNMMSEDIVSKELELIKPKIIIHCAGSADVRKSVLNPLMDYQSNVTLTHILLFTLHKLGMDSTKVIFLSSAGVYGNPSALPISEKMILNPLSPYAVHKVMCEDLCKYFINNYNMDIKIARIFSAYGIGLKKQIFWDMYQKYKNNGFLEMLGSGLESRDYIHVNDVIQSIYLLATIKSEKIVFNVGNGEEVTIRQATKIFSEVMGISENRISFNGVVREGDPLNWKSDISAIQELGYRKTVNMDEGIREYVKWCDSIGDEKNV